jgi:ribosomal protein S18 acetylase RimI-like enzyme
MFSYKKSLIFASAIFISSIAHSSEFNEKAVIKDYDKQRDETAIIAILDQYPKFLRYESMGLPVGTTEQYINNSKYTTHVIQENDLTVGFVSFIKIDKRLLFLNFGSIGLIHLMGIDTEHQGKHYGNALLSHAINELLDKGVSQIFLTTKVTNEKARKLYEKSGFKLVTLVGEDCFYLANFVNEKAPQPTIEEKALQCALRHPGKSLLCLCAVLIGGGYASYKGMKSLWHQFYI